MFDFLKKKEKEQLPEEIAEADVSGLEAEDPGDPAKSDETPGPEDAKAQTWDYGVTMGVPAYYHAEDLCGQDFLRVDRLRNPTLEGSCGELAGRRFPVYGVLTVGTDPRCDIRLSPAAPGVSGLHLRFWLDSWKIHAMDMGSSEGSWLNGRRMLPGLAYKLNSEDLVAFGHQEELAVY